MSRRLPSLNQLRAFEAAARHCSFKLGAAELCVTQAAVSHQVKALEDALGLTLFVRRTRGIEPTAEARRLLPVLTRAFDDIEAATLDVSTTALTGELRVTAAPFYGNRWLLPRLDGFHAAHPGLTVSVSLSFEVVDLAAEGYDAALRFGTGAWPGLAATHIHNDRIGPVCAPGYVRGCALPLEPAEIARLSLATTRDLAGEWTAWFTAAGHSPSPDPDIVEHPNRALAFDSALSGMGVCLADARLSGAAEAAGHLVRLHPATVVMPRGMYLVHPERPRPDPRVAAFAEWLKREAAQPLSGDTEPTE
ncbi:LysR substrate-binding domain-containing protein [Roseovarius salis]|uniref:LysR substrate-binding domain-containing protein n=1 Tax=Roseovarius salis TaxID=3376063 RepID=UPI0037C58BF6